MSQLYHAWLMMQLKDQTGHVFIFPASLKDACAKVSNSIMVCCCQQVTYALSAAGLLYCCVAAALSDGIYTRRPVSSLNLMVCRHGKHSCSK